MDKLSILLVDDDQINNFLNVDLFNKMNIAREIEVCEDGEQAIKLLEEKSTGAAICPDLIFIDINMPIVDGYEFVKGFRKLKFNNNCKLVMLTTSEAPKDRKKTMDLGTKLLSKPLTEEKIFELIKNT